MTNCRALFQIAVVRAFECIDRRRNFFTDTPRRFAPSDFWGPLRLPRNTIAALDDRDRMVDDVHSLRINRF
jgi:hypothetical protein